MPETVVVETSDETPDEIPDVTVEEGDTTVVVETPTTEETTGDTDAAFTLGSVVERLNVLEDRLNETVWKVDDAQITADVALDAALEADETAEEVGDATVEVAEAVVNDDTTELEESAEELPETEDSILPQKKHLVHRSFREIIGRG